MQGLDLLLLLGLFLYVVLRSWRGSQDSGEGGAPSGEAPPREARGPGAAGRPGQVRGPVRGPGAPRGDVRVDRPVRRDPIQEALERWEARIPRGETERMGREEAQRLERAEAERRRRLEGERARAAAEELAGGEALAREWRERERDTWVEAAEGPAPEARRVEQPSASMPARGAAAMSVPPAAVSAATPRADRRRGAGAALAALDRRPPLQRAILYAEILGAPRSLRPPLPSLVRERPDRG